MLTKPAVVSQTGKLLDWKTQHALILGALLVLLLVEFFYISTARLLSDESFNFRQISRFLAGDIRMEPEMNVIPGYHALIALLMSVTGRTGTFAARFFSTGISFLTILVFYFLTGKTGEHPSIEKTLQFAVFPLFFPFFPLIYTDILGLLLPLAGLYLLLVQRPGLAGLAGILGVLARTNNVIWLVFLLVLAAIEPREWDRKGIHQFLRQSWVFWIGLFAFAVFLAVNGGIAISNQEVQPLFRFESGNLVFLLFLSAFLFLPLLISRIPAALKMIREHPWMLAALAGILALFWFTFRPDHPYNLAEPDYYLRNRLLMAAAADPLNKLFFFLPVAFTLLSLPGIHLADRRWRLLYPFTIFSLVPFWLIEPRYSFVPLALFILFKREEQPRWITAILVGLYFIGSLATVYFMRNEQFFI